MAEIMNRPLLVFVATFVVLWVATHAGVAIRRRREDMNAEEREDYGMILTATLTLLGLIIGFTFSMAISRYDQRKNYEEEEANAIGTEYLRTELLPGATAEKVKALLREYVGMRVRFYEARGTEELREVNARTAEVQTSLWNAVREQAGVQQSAVTALTVSGMNDVLNTQGYTQAAWWNRIPLAAWGLLWAIAICCNVMIGYYVRPEKRHWMHLGVMPLVVAVAFLLIADIDSPRGGIIRVVPQNLESLAGTLK